MTCRPNWDLSGGREIDTDLPSGRDVFRNEPDDDRERFDPAEERSPSFRPSPRPAPDGDAA